MIDTVSDEAAMRKAAARRERQRLLEDGAAPSTESILREMGRGPDGEPIEDGPDEFVPASTAAIRALPDREPVESVDEDDPDECDRCEEELDLVESVGHFRACPECAIVLRRRMG
jgi:hypothetical protein